ncbi:hypothetical protein PUNSTDRAFT_142743 [Punctularia strigosozonata HHB-11173 SS5]|uniref:uncharacterized protein n=1 Tax=Punctularia strigosozonata (strain HHB-11173) TaxID=741275 RepID=UPI0004416FA5|nr:uncharacterized protein PUNSTDRAFT_142743 [Punctularia strigosozonata HHB-11173 SS5]EIN10819.1 hypothetical protein PUNSTDRAFT_142743 [Punctularia strigosozonata HHB-11173 SS5]
MNKNPFIPTPSYSPPQPPLPPGPPPHSGQPDYSGYWAAAGSQPQAQGAGAYGTQWTPPQPATPQQSALYANYGYGGQQPWQQQQQRPAQPQHFPAPPPMVQAAPPQPAYNPYQPQAGAGFVQPYVPQPGPAPQVPMQQQYQPHFPQPPHQPPQPYQPQAPQLQQHPTGPRQHQQNPMLHPPPPPHMSPPAKRPRFDGPNNQQGFNNNSRPPAQFPNPPPPTAPQAFGAGPGHGRGGGPGVNQMPLGGSGSRGGMAGGRGGSNMGRGGKSGFMNNRGGQANRGGRGGSMHGSMSGAGRGGSQGAMGFSGNLRGHGSRGNAYGNNNNRRGGGGGGSFNAGRPDQQQSQGANVNQSQNGSFRGRSGHFNQNRSGGHKHEGGKEGHAPPLGPSASLSQMGGATAKKDENRRTLTDFKIVGLQITDLGWSWGVLPKQPASHVKKEEEESELPEPSGTTQPLDDVKVNDEGVAVSDTDTQPDDSNATGAEGAVKREPTEASLSAEVDRSSGTITDLKSSLYAGSLYSQSSSAASPPSRIRIYFHTPVTADDSHPIPHSNASSFTHVIGGGVPLGPAADFGRKGKRARRDRDDDSDGDAEEGRTRPPPPGEMDRESVAASANADVDESRASVAPSVTLTESVGEGDWLMGAMGGEGHDTDRYSDGDAQTVVDDHGDEPSQYERGVGDEQPHPEHAAHVDSSFAPDSQVTDAGLGGPAATGETSDLSSHGTSVTLPTAGLGDATKEFLAEHPAESNLTTVDEHHTEPLTVQPATNGAVEDGKDAASLEAVNGTALVSDTTSVGSSISNVDALEGTVNVEQGTGTVGNASSIATVPEAVGTEGNVPTNSDESSEAAATTHMHDAAIPDVEGNHPSTASEDGVAELVNALESGATDNGQEGHDDVPHDDSLGLETSISTTVESDTQPTQTSPTLTSSKLKDPKAAHVPSANRLSISYAAGSRRLVIDAQVVETLKVYRAEGRIEVALIIDREGEGFRGIQIEGLSDITKAYSPLNILADTSDADDTLPPLGKAETPMHTVLIVYLDTEKPLSEPKWVKSGDVQEWLKSMFGRMFWVAGDAADGWEKRIQVVDPDPAPTIWTVLEGWATNSPVGTQTERQRFLRTHMTETDNILEILLRLVRGERATAFAGSSSTISAPSVSGPLLSALSPGSAHGAQQTHVSLAVLAMFRMSVEYAKKAMGDKGKTEVEERMGEIIRCLPSHLLYKSLDGIFKEWKAEKKGGGR